MRIAAEQPVGLTATSDAPLSQHERMTQLRDELLQKALSYNSREWTSSLINSAYHHGELDMLEFFKLRMTRDHLPDILRVVLIHAQNLGLDPADVTEQMIDAYAAVTMTEYFGVGVLVRSTSVETSNALIRIVLSNQAAACSVIPFVNERGLHPDALLEHLCALNSTPSVLIRGTL